MCGVVQCVQSWEAICVQCSGQCDVGQWSGNQHGLLLAPPCISKESVVPFHLPMNQQWSGPHIAHTALYYTHTPHHTYSAHHTPHITLRHTTSLTTSLHATLHTPFTTIKISPMWMPTSLSLLCVVSSNFNPVLGCNVLHLCCDKVTTWTEKQQQGSFSTLHITNHTRSHTHYTTSLHHNITLCNAWRCRCSVVCSRTPGKRGAIIIMYTCV